MTRTKTKGVLNVSDDDHSYRTRSNSNPSVRDELNSTSAKAVSPHKLLANSDEICKICKRIIDDNRPGEKAIQCDRCVAWVHYKCSKTTAEEYAFLTSHPSTAVLWYCKVCQDELKEGPGSNDNRLAQQSAKIDTLTKKTDSLTFLIYECRTQMATMQSQLSTFIEDASKSTKNNCEAETTKQLKSEMQAQITEALDDKEEREEKKNDVIMFNVPEVEPSNEEQELKEDTENVKIMLAMVLPVNGKVPIDEKNISRIGKARKDGKSRPIRIRFEDDTSKGLIFRNSAKLKKYEQYKKVNITSNKTRKELLADKMLKDRLDEQKRLRPDDDLIIYRGDIIKRADRPQRPPNRAD